MFDNSHLMGILLGSAKFVCRVQRDDKMYIGYSVKMAIELRAKSADYLYAIQRSLRNTFVESVVREKESRRRASPILTIRGIGNIRNVLRLIPEHYINGDNTLKDFRATHEILRDGRHKTDKGLEEILILKGVLNGIDFDK